MDSPRSTSSLSLEQTGSAILSETNKTRGNIRHNLKGIEEGQRNSSSSINETLQMIGQISGQNWMLTQRPSLPSDYNWLAW